MIQILRSPRSLVALLTALVLAGCTTRASVPDEAGPAASIPVRVRTARAVERPETFRVSGTVEADRTAELGFQIGGKVVQVAVDEGQVVAAGHLLAVLDPTDHELAIERAVVTSARAADEHARMKALYERGSLPANDYEGYETQARLAETEEKMARKALGDTRLVASIGGIVARRGVDPGETAAPGAPLFTLVRIDPVVVRVGVPEAQIGRIARGAAATVEIPALGGRRFQGRVSMMGVSADPSSRTYPIELTVENPAHVLLPGMIAEVEIRGDEVVRALTLPGEAIVRDPEGAARVYVYLPDEQRVYARQVTTGAVLDREVAITGGLAPSELVVVAGQHQVYEGAVVHAALEAQHASATETEDQP